MAFNGQRAIDNYSKNNVTSSTIGSKTENVALERFNYLLFLFLTTGVLGWIMELCFRTVYYGEVTIPGFLTGPFCSIYGVACVMFSVLCRGESKGSIFLKGAFFSTLIEYIIYTIFFNVFGVMLWDYTDIPLHIGPSISLPFTFIWGILSVLFVCYLEPLIIKIYNNVKPIVVKSDIVIGLLLIVDFIITSLIHFSIITLPALPVLFVHLG